MAEQSTTYRKIKIFDDTAKEMLQVEDLKVIFQTPHSIIKAVDGVSFTVHERESFGIVGESGSGKSVTCRSIARLIHLPGKITSGSILFEGLNLLALTDRDLNAVRGRQIGMIFQDPMTALNPVMKIRDQILETFQEDHSYEGEAAIERAVSLMKMVGIPAPERRLNEYPHQFSGGMRQRVMIAISLSRSPRLILADEPTTAVDVTIQDQILKLLLHIQHESGMSLVLVTHDLGVVAQTCDRVAVMYAGRIMELTDTITLFKEPHHPYTMGLLSSVPSALLPGGKLLPIPGQPPNMAHLPSGCRFSPRCQFATDECRVGEFPLRTVGPKHYSACIKDLRPGQGK
jgi:oligopeptide/dipeptide ABC transporter ATP-binding protein